MELNSFSELYKDITSKDPILFVFDVDLVITMAKDPTFHPLTLDRHHKHLNPMVAALDEEQEEMFYSLIAVHPERALVETIFPDTLKAIYANGHKALALTAQLATTYNGINTVERRLEELTTFDIDFSQSFPHIQPFEFTNGKKYFGHLPCFRSGVIFSNGLVNSKGKILKEFFEINQLAPQKVIFIDDLIGNVLSIRNSMLDLGIPCDAYHYKGIEQLDIPHIELSAAKNAWSSTIQKALSICSHFQQS